MQIDRPIAIAIILFIVLLLIFFLVAPEYRTFKELRTDLGEKIAEFNAEYDYYAEITKTYHTLRARQEDIQKIDDALPEDPNFGKLVYYFQKTSAENGMIIRDLFLSKSSLANASGKANNVNDIIFSMNLIGDYKSLGNFLVSLEKSARLFEVTSISFSSESQVQTSPASLPSQIQQIYTFNLEVKTHSY
jgi:hypothetical protein